MPTNESLNRKLRMGLVGGGQGAFIGRVHATAAILDNRASLVAGALSSDPAKAKASAPDYDIKPERAYGSVKDMIAAELKLPASERIDFVSVATPNHTHFDIAKAFAEAGFNVMCDKPMTFDLAQAEEFLRLRVAPNAERIEPASRAMPRATRSAGPNQAMPAQPGITALASEIAPKTTSRVPR